MGFRFRKSIPIGKHFRINLSKSGVGYSCGVKGARFTKTANGKNRTTLSVPGTGISYTTESKAHTSRKNRPERNAPVEQQSPQNRRRRRQQARKIPLPTAHRQKVHSTSLRSKPRIRFGSGSLR